MRLGDPLGPEVRLAQVLVDVVLDALQEPVGARDGARQGAHLRLALAVQRAHQPDDGVGEVRVLGIDAAVVQPGGDPDEERPRDLRQPAVAAETQRGASPDAFGVLAQHRHAAP